jgi:hypothetical protein
MPAPQAPAPLQTKRPKAEQAALEEQVPLFSEKWAAIVRPVTCIFFVLLGLAILIPFVFIWYFEGNKERLELVMDWAKTILPPLTGFGGAVIGYYFGIRAVGHNS